MNSWSCVLNSFAYAINLPAADLQRYVGHDGSEIINPTLPEPFCRRGFCLEEFFEVLLDLGYACVHIPKHRTINNMMMLEPLVVDQTDRVARHLSEHQFVLYDNRHCIGVRGGKVFDPNNQIKDLTAFNYAGIIILRILD